MPAEAPLHTFVCPAMFDSVADCQSWNLGDVPEGHRLLFDLRRWRNVAPESTVGIIASIGSWADHPIEVRLPTDPYTARLLQTIGFMDALQTISDWTDLPNTKEPVRRILPIIKVQQFDSTADVERLGAELEERFSANKRLSANLLQDAYLVLTEAADNVITHSASPWGGFALAQVRERRVYGVRRRFIEVAVADSGQGLAGSLKADEGREVIEEAMRDRVSSTGDPARGFGLGEMQRTARAAPERRLTVHSGTGLVVTGRGYDLSQDVPSRFPGTLVSVSIPAG